MNDDPKNDRQALEHHANVVRASLMNHLDVLDRRRHEVLDVRFQVRRHFRVLLFAAAAVGVVVVGGVGVGVYRLVSRPRRMRAQRWGALGRAWRRPDLAVSPRPAFWSSVASALGSVALSALVGVAKHVAGEMLATKELGHPVPPTE